MRGIIAKKWVNLIVVMTLLAGAFAGCGTRPNNATVTNRTGSAILPKEESEEAEETASEEDDSESESKDSDLYIVESLDMTEETISLYSLSTGKQLRYNYNMTTKFLDKYGGRGTWAEFTTGSVVSIGSLLPASGALSQIQKSADVWYFEDITKYKIDEERGLIQIDGKNYKLTDSTKVYSDSEKILLSSIGENDAITVIGRDKDIISIAVTTGHGYINLVHTELFDGSMIFIGNKIVSIVNGPETIEVPEGTYKITVANNGWGGSETFTVARGDEVRVDLDEMKGDGPSYCLLTFLVTVPDTYVYLDGKLIDTNEPQNVQYGSHRLVVQCAGYASWNKTLVVNSESAEITLAMETEDDSANSANSTDSASTSTTEAQSETANAEENTTNTTSEATTTTNGHEEETAGSSIKNDYDYDVDYLSTISDLIGNLMH